MPIPVTVVGCGAVIQELYKKPLQTLERRGMIEVVGLVDRDLSRARVFQRQFKKASSFDNLVSAFDATGSRLTVVASPASLHAEHAIVAMQNRNHVICEKPMAATGSECQQMHEVSCDTGMKLSVGMIRRYYPSMIRVKNLLAKNAIGAVQSFSYREGRPYSWPAVSAASFQNRPGGGILMDIGSHVFDWFIWLFGAPRIVAHFDDSMKNGIEASCITRLLFGAVSGTIHLSWDYDLKNSLVVTGSKGKITVPFNDIHTVHAFDEAGSLLPLPEVVPPHPGDEEGTLLLPRTTQDCIYNHIVEMVRAITKDEPPAIAGCEGLAVISAIEQCYRIAEPTDMNWLPEEQNRSFKKLHWRT